MKAEVINGVNEIQNSEKYKAATVELETLKIFLEIINGLLVQWKLVKTRDYIYRFSLRVEAVPLLDLKGLNQSIITTDSLWLSMRLLEEPLCHIKSPQAEMFAVMMQRELMSILNLISNEAEQPLGDLESLTTALCHKNRSLSKKLGIMPVEKGFLYTGNKPDYQELKIICRSPA